MPQPEEPLTIPYTKLIELIAALGIKSDPQDIRSIHMENNRITVVRYRRNSEGLMVVAGDEAATTTITIGVKP